MDPWGNPMRNMNTHSTSIVTPALLGQDGRRKQEHPEAHRPATLVSQWKTTRRAFQTRGR